MCMYKLEDVKRLGASMSFPAQDHNLHTLLLVLEASGSIEIGTRQIVSLQDRQFFVIGPNTPVSLKLVPDQEHQAEYYCIWFHVMQESEAGHFTPVDIGDPGERFIANDPFLLDRLREMESYVRSHHHWNRMKANIIFQEALLLLFQGASSKKQLDISQAIARTLDYMEQYYAEPINREKLAAMAGVSSDYYTRAFKKIVGKSPMEYLSEIRIHRAKQLIPSGDSMRAIAQSVGFSDEFYFSRKFKAMTGRSPITYLKTFRQGPKIASLKPLLTGHLLALGIEPHASVVNRACPVATGAGGTMNIGELMPDLDKLVAARPDLILTRERRDCGKSQKEKMYDHIAPTVTLPFYDSWRNHLQTIAKVVDREQEAYDWLQRYERQSAITRDRLRNKLGDESILVVGISGDKICVYGQRNLGAVLYGDLQLAMPEGVAAIAHCKEVTLEQLAQFEAGHILLTSYKHDGTAVTDLAIREQIDGLSTRAAWQKLKAVRDGAVYSMYDSRHLYTSYNSWSHKLLLEQAERLLLSDSSKGWS